MYRHTIMYYKILPAPKVFSKQTHNLHTKIELLDISDFLITTYIIEHCNNKTPGEITDIRSSLVNNITFASLSIRIGLHRFILAQSVKLTEAIDRFYEYQQKNNHKIGQEVRFYLYNLNNNNNLMTIKVSRILFYY